MNAYDPEQRNMLNAGRFDANRIEDGYAILAMCSGRRADWDGVIELIEFNADVNFVSPCGTTAMDQAIRHERVMILQTLVTNGAKAPDVGTGLDALKLLDDPYRTDACFEFAKSVFRMGSFCTVWIRAHDKALEVVRNEVAGLICENLPVLPDLQKAIIEFLFPRPKRKRSI